MSKANEMLSIHVPSFLELLREVEVTREDVGFIVFMMCEVQARGGEIANEFLVVDEIFGRTGDSDVVPWQPFFDISEKTIRIRDWKSKV